jgi:arylsulfatase A-like enzyme
MDRLGYTLAITALTAALGCATEPAPPPNLILVSIDTLRADHLPSYGYARETAPALDRLAREGVVFEQAVANSPWTLPSHASMFTGLEPHRHGLVNYRARLREDTPSLAPLMQQAGYTTVSLVNTLHLKGRYGLARGFDEHVVFSEREGQKRLRAGRRQIDLLLLWLDRRPDAPFFVFLHNYDVHSDYDPSPEFASLFVGPYDGPATGTSQQLLRGAEGLSASDVQHLIDLYDGGIRQLDAQIGRLLDHLDETGLAESTYVVVTSDHGEEFLEHGGVLHGETCYEEALRVPLILRGPGIPPGTRVAGLVQLTDLFPTLLELAGVPRPRGIDGISLVGSWSGAGTSPRRRAFAETRHPLLRGGSRHMVREGSLKLIHEPESGRVELYDLASDPKETRDLSRDRPEAVRRLLALLDPGAEVAAASEPLPPLEPEELESLRSRGYVE